MFEDDDKCASGENVKKTRANTKMKRFSFNFALIIFFIFMLSNIIFIDTNEKQLISLSNKVNPSTELKNLTIFFKYSKCLD